MMVPQIHLHFQIITDTIYKVYFYKGFSPYEIKNNGLKVKEFVVFL